MSDAFDIAIVGAGPVGAGLALALDGAGYRVAVIEAAPPSSETGSTFDARSLALAWASRQVLATIHPTLWAEIEAGAAPIHRIHVSDRGRPGFARLDRDDEGVAALGWVVENRLLGRALHAALERSGVEFICPARVTAVDRSPRRARVLAEGPEGRVDLTAALLVAADGGNSAVREGAGIGTRRVEYGQTAVIANVAPALDPGTTAWERFTETGPLALLPLTQGRCSLVWTCRKGEEQELLGLDDAAFLQRLEARFGGRLGGFTAVGERHAYPLGLQYAERFTDRRLAVIGNAAHVLHPVAGQGYNLGLRDAAVLAEVLADARRAGRDPGDEALLADYARRRRADYARTTAFTDGLVRTFSNAVAPVAALRAAGLVALDRLPPARHALARQAMGLGGRVPRLARGLAP
ncbi:2-octaprenyl-6-methoxyphenyl hydroxylase [Thiohalospira sp.]|uniref:2-octaprenyl-6-methoxyphenyl hydroxylase n=1 Tax=Thiohalospira sp. TaxID=3080549 RepID=UPI00397F0DD7